MNSTDTSLAHSILRQHLLTPSTVTMLIAMAVEDMNLPKSFFNELEQALQRHESNERILGQDVVTGRPKVRAGLTHELTTGIEPLRAVLVLLDKLGFLNAASLSIRFNDSGSGIQGITLSFLSSTETRLPATNGESIPSTLIQNSPDTRIPTDNLPLSIAPDSIPGILWSVKES